MLFVVLILLGLTLCGFSELAFCCSFVAEVVVFTDMALFLLD